MTHRLQVLVQTPAHSAIAGSLTYLSEQALPAGTLVRVPFGKRETLGVVWEALAQVDGTTTTTTDLKLRAIAGPLEGIAALSDHWQQLVTFAATYYQRSVGEVALAALPPQLRDLNATQLARRIKRRVMTPSELAGHAGRSGTKNQAVAELTPLSTEQAAVVARFEEQSGETHPRPVLLFGATGSGKTEVYLRCVENVLGADLSAQALVMVPEINLTPQLEERFRARFVPQYGEVAVVSMHSGMTPAQRLKAWLAAHAGVARIVLGTRLAIFASMRQLKLIVVDEEHDPSYKQTEGARYSARDLAVWRARQEGARVILGSATPSLESWHGSRPAEDGGRYLRLHMPSRIASRLGQAAQLPKVVRVDMNHQPKKTIISPPLLNAIQERAARGEQSLIFLNRRGYAPVLACTACDWKSECPHCSAYRVFHKIDRSIRCHHCGFTEPVPRACPQCGNIDLQTVGRGTERLEEHLAELLAQVRRPGTESALQPEGAPLRIARIDADSTRLKGELEKQLARVHGGEVDVLVGTQMIAKGHDFRRITLVAAVNPDGALFSSDFRAPERLFSLLMQAAGRSGRDATLSGQSEMWLQTFYPQHPFFDALKKHDFPAFADQQLRERQSAALPPFSFQALMRAEARTQDVAQGFLRAGQEAAQALPEAGHVTIYPAVPVGIQRVANVERAQMLIESPSRARLQAFLAAWHSVLHTTRKGPSGKGLIRWAVDVDPLLI
jgi:primosomal protein N' (replication factor Y) (superfamily II helicase)